MTKTIVHYSVLTLTLAVFLSGCGGAGGPARHHLKGSATFDGQPIIYGEVFFYPESGPEGYAIIRNGEFTTDNENGKAVVDGQHRILVTAFSFEPLGLQEDETADTSNDVSPEILFVNFELNGDLSGPDFSIQVPAEAKGFDASSAAAKRASNEP